MFYYQIYSFSERRSSCWTDSHVLIRQHPNHTYLDVLFRDGSRPSLEESHLWCWRCHTSLPIFWNSSIFCKCSLSPYFPPPLLFPPTPFHNLLLHSSTFPSSFFLLMFFPLFTGNGTKWSEVYIAEKICSFSKLGANFCVYSTVYHY